MADRIKINEGLNILRFRVNDFLPGTTTAVPTQDYTLNISAEHMTSAPVGDSVSLIFEAQLLGADV